jgi:hypothetical protein
MCLARTASTPSKGKNDYAFQHQLNEKPSIMSGCPGTPVTVMIGLLRGAT